MKKSLILTLLFCLGVLSPLLAEQPTISFIDLIAAAEEDFKVYLTAKKTAIEQGLPFNIYLPEGIHIQALGVEEDKVVYSLIYNVADLYEKSEAVFFEEIEKRFDLSSARVHYGNGIVSNESLGIPTGSTQLLPSLLLIPESSNDRVMAFDPMTGDLVDADFIPAAPVELSTPIMAQKTPGGNISISDQLDDLVQEFDTTGLYLGFYAPAGGVNTAILDNIRGHNYKDDGNLLVTVAGGTNSDAIAEFDQSGNYLGNFIAPNTSILDGPFDLIFRTSDVLVTGGTMTKWITMF